MNLAKFSLFSAVVFGLLACGNDVHQSQLAGGNRRGGGEVSGPVGSPIVNAQAMARAFEVQTLLWRAANQIDLTTVKMAEVTMVNSNQISIVTERSDLGGNCSYFRKTSQGGRSLEDVLNCGAEIVGSGEVEATTVGIYALVGSVRVVAAMPEMMPSEDTAQVASFYSSFLPESTSTLVRATLIDGSVREFTCTNPISYYQARSCSRSSSN